MGERAFGPYRLVRQIAVGGMAEIHLAKTRGIAGFEKYVALKMIHPNFAQDEQFIQMLIDEAKIAVQLQHVNVAQTFDLGRVGETYYITLEYVDGADLYKVLRRGSEQDVDMPLDTCAYVAKEMATGLDYAHRKRGNDGKPMGIVHRDVSPQNVLISYAGEVKLVDFGIAKATMRARQTQVGVIKGKYYYMSPEQAWGDPLDHRSDIFSCGIVLYEMITGQMLYLEEDLQRLLEMVRKADIAPPSRLRKGVPPQLERIVMHALAKRPEDRYQSAADMATDLERFLHAYSPVFTATKLSAHLRQVVGEPVPIVEAPAPGAQVPRDPGKQTQPIDRRELASDRSEVGVDENSVIFRVDELRARAARDSDGYGDGGTGPGTDGGEDNSTAAELPRGSRRAPTRDDAPIGRARPAAPAGRARPPTQPPPTPQPPPRGRSSAPTTPATARPPTAQPARPPTAQPARPPTAQPARPPTTPAPARPPTARSVAGAPAPPVRAGSLRPADRTTVVPDKVATLTMPADLGEIEEMTSISGPPGFDGPTHTDGPTKTMQQPAPPAPLDYGDYEPTMIEGDGMLAAAADAPEPTDSEDGPTVTRDGAGVPLPAAVQLSSSETAPRHAELRSRARPGAPAHPALSASSPTPAVSALRPGKGSRRTPPGGVPVAGGSVLQAIVGKGSGEPMPTVPLRTSSDGVPHAVPDGAPSHAQTQPQAGFPPQMHAVPGHHALPAHGAPPPPAGLGPPPAQPPQPHHAHGQGPMPLVAPPTPMPGSLGMPHLPPHMMPYQMPPAAQVVMPGYGPPGQGVPGQPAMPGQTPGYGYPYGPPGAAPGQPGMTFTKQMQAALDVDEIPAHYKLERSTGNRIAWILAAMMTVLGAVVATVLLMRTSDGPSPSTLVIESVPSGASVKVDGEALTETTPARFRTRPGARHEVRVELPRHKPWTDTVVVSGNGGDLKIVAVLKTSTGKLRINSAPGGAEVWIGGQRVGVTPAAIDIADPTQVKEVELRHKDFGSVVQAVTWDASDTAAIDVNFRK